MSLLGHNQAAKHGPHTLHICTAHLLLNKVSDKSVSQSPPHFPPPPSHSQHRDGEPWKAPRSISGPPLSLPGLRGSCKLCVHRGIIVGLSFPPCPALCRCLVPCGPRGYLSMANSEQILIQGGWDLSLSVAFAGFPSLCFLCKGVRGAVGGRGAFPCLGGSAEW